MIIWAYAEGSEQRFLEAPHLPFGWGFAFVLPRAADEKLCAIGVFPSNSFSNKHLDSPPGPSESRSARPLSNVRMMRAGLAKRAGICFRSQSPGSQSAPLKCSNTAGSRGIEAGQNRGKVAKLNGHGAESTTTIFTGTMEHGYAAFTAFAIPAIAGRRGSLVYRG